MPSIVPKSTPASWRFSAWISPLLLLCVAYALLGLTFTERLSHSEVMQRCVLMNPNLARIWSVSNIEIGLAYFGVFGGMVYYFIRMYHHSRRHVLDLAAAVAYLLVSFILDYVCVQHFEPFVAMLIGDAAVMTFTLIVSRQVWFQRLLGVFVPIIFLTCACGHFMEGLSYWHLTYPLNVPWTMVTADCGFAVLVNTARFPALIRGEDLQDQLEVERTRRETLENEVAQRIRAEEALRVSERQRELENRQREHFTRDVMYAVTNGRIRLHEAPSTLPPALSKESFAMSLSLDGMAAVRSQVSKLAAGLGFAGPRRDDLVTASSEAIMNAIVHASGAAVKVTHDSETIQVRVEDQGTGMPLNVLPYATLQAGWSSKGTLGLGFTLISNADAVDLLTGPLGTTLVLTMAARQPADTRFGSTG